MDTSILKQLGLTENEITIYLFLLKHPDITTGKIIKETKIANSRVYDSLNSLILKGFVTYNLQKDGKHFQSSSPKIFLEKQDEIKNKIKDLIPQLDSLQTSKKDNTTLGIYEGFDGFKTAFKKIIEDCPKGETIYIIGFPEQLNKTEILQTFLTNQNLKSATKKQKLKIILEQSTRQTLGKNREKEKFTEVRYMQKGFISPIAMDIFQDYVYMFLWEEKPYVFMIRNKTIAQSFKHYHEFLWKITKPQ